MSCPCLAPPRAGLIPGERKLALPWLWRGVGWGDKENWPSSRHSQSRPGRFYWNADPHSLHTPTQEARRELAHCADESKGQETACAQHPWGSSLVLASGLLPVGLPCLPTAPNSPLKSAQRAPPAGAKLASASSPLQSRSKVTDPVGRERLVARAGMPESGRCGSQGDRLEQGDSLVTCCPSCSSVTNQWTQPYSQGVGMRWAPRIHPGPCGLGLAACPLPCKQAFGRRLLGR